MMVLKNKIKSVDIAKEFLQPLMLDVGLNRKPEFTSEELPFETLENLLGIIDASQAIIA